MAATQTREHISAVEMENDYGYRYWASMPDSEVGDYIKAEQALGAVLSDLGCSGACWCFNQ